ncbi:hypothetical protein D9758_014103 [Tetrapyrgos nigripes]|uniref:NmrA-like domain-containing protein n=1 Tax=Tetrapyrgos nigripes TaxID=182062 RepID=A0A8H5CCM9_9AGAR|nr:hypothetical protein D9758_014103 [Tetrapyrgos nigripes]
MVKSQRVAVAGGTGGIGRHVVEGLLALQKRSPGSLSAVIVLSRSKRPDIEFEGGRAPVYAVDYNDPTSIEKVLSELHIDTIISTLACEPSIFIPAQNHLLAAALKVPSVHRFAPSEFAPDPEQLVSAPLYQMKHPILKSLREAKAERPGKFEFTKFTCGIFMNYFGFGNTKDEGHKAHGHLADLPYMLDLSKQMADVPGDGNMKCWVTAAEDIGDFVAEATQLEIWPEECTMSGDVLTVNEIIQLAEKITGKKLQVKHNTREDIEARKVPDINPDPWYANLYLDIYICYINNEHIQKTSVLNELTNVKPITVEEFLEKWWGKE